MLLYILLMLLIFLCILVVRALLLKPEKMPEAVVAAEDEEIHEEDTVRHMQALIRCRTVSSSDPEKEDPKEFDRLTGLLPSLFPNVHKVCEFTMPSTRSLVFRWKGKDSSSSAVLMAHYDVVPVHEPSWSKPPFDAIIEDGVMWGRGTIDTKSTFLGILEAADTLIREGYQPQHDLYLCFSGTEEVNGFGAPAIVRYLKEKGIRPSFVLDEGGAVVSGAFPSVRMRSAVIGIAEKGTMAVRFSVPGAGGHASTPPSCSSIRMLSDAVHKVETHPDLRCRKGHLPLHGEPCLVPIQGDLCQHGSSASPDRAHLPPDRGRDQCAHPHHHSLHPDGRQRGLQRHAEQPLDWCQCPHQRG